MATTTATWSAEQTGHNGTIASASTGDTNIDLEGNGWDMVTAMIDVDLGTASSLDVRIFRSTDGGTDFTDQSLAGGFSIDSNGVYPVDITAESYAQLSILNNDGSSATNTVTVTYQGRKWETV